MFEYITVSSEEEYLQAGILFREYSDWLKIDLTFQNFEVELKELKKMYEPPKGTIILCKQGENYIACVAVRPNLDLIAELKRMYVKPAFQKKGIGQILLNGSLQFAIEAGYKKIRLDTLNTMNPAMSLYEKNGFYQTEAYYFNPEKSAVYYEREL